MKSTICILIFGLILIVDCLGVSYEPYNLNVYGDTNYTSNNSHSLETNIYVEYNIPIYEPDHKKWGLFIAGKVNPTYDHLGNELKVDVFTVLGIDF